MYTSLLNRGTSLQDFFDRHFESLNHYDSALDSNFGKYKVSSSQEAHTIQISLPGHDKESVNLTVDENRLVIKAVAPENSSDLTKNESFKFRLPKDCNAQEIDAQIKNGILTVTIAKEVEKSKSKKIEISVN
jgi:HSP20 family molecular chaperone IbpA